MTGEQREHIAATIAILDMVNAIMLDHNIKNSAKIVGAQCELLQEVLDNDVED